MAIIESLTKKSIRDELINMNSILKTLYKFYVSYDNIIIPAKMDDILDPTIFKRSVIISKFSGFDFLKNTIVDPENLNKALRNKYYDSTLKSDNCYYLKNDDNEELLVSKLLTITNINDMSYYQGLSELNDFKPDEWPVVYNITPELKESLLNYDNPVVTLGEYEGIEINMIMTVKLLPALKKTDNIQFFVKPYSLEKDKIFEVCIVSALDSWTLYTMHKIIIL